RLGILGGARVRLALRERERALRFGAGQLALAAVGQRLRQREVCSQVLRIDLQRRAHEALAFLAVAAEQARQATEERALGEECVGIVWRQLESAVDLAAEPPEGDQVPDAGTAELHLLAEVADDGEVRLGVAVILRDGLLGELQPPREERALLFDGARLALAQGERLVGAAGARRGGGQRAGAEGSQSDGGKRQAGGRAARRPVGNRATK